MLILLLAGAVVSVVAHVKLARLQGRRPLLWAIPGALLGVFTLLTLLVLPSKVESLEGRVALA